MSVYDTMTVWNEEREEYVSSRKVGKPMGPGAPHYPNKAERVLLTQMMQKSGQTEEQVRANIDNRRKLAAASKAMTHPVGNPAFRKRLAENRANRYSSSPQHMWNILKK